MKKQKLSEIFNQTFEEIDENAKDELVAILRELAIFELEFGMLKPAHINELIQSSQQKGITNFHIEELVVLMYKQIHLSGHQPPDWLDFFNAPPSMICMQPYELELLASLSLTNGREKTRDLLLWISFSGLPLDRSAGYVLPQSVEELKSLRFKPFANNDHTTYVLNTSLITQLAGKYPSGLPVISEAEFRENAEDILRQTNINRRVELLSEAMDFSDPYVIPIPYVFRSRFCQVTNMLFRDRYCQRSPFREFVQHNEYFNGKRIRKFVEPHLDIRWT